MKRESVNGKCIRTKTAKEGREKRTGSGGRYPAFMAAVAAAAVLMAGCGASGNSMSDSAVASSAQYNGSEAFYTSDAKSAAGASYDMELAVSEESATYDSAEFLDPAAAPGEGSAADLDLSQSRKLIKTVELEMETKEFERMMTELETQIQDLGGYVESLDTYNGSSYSGHRNSRWANMTIRIPRQALNGFLQNMSEIGNVIRRSDSVEDVTLSYVDMESRRDTLRAEQERLLELMERAETVEDMIVLEERLSNVRYCLESMESRLRTIDNQVDYSTVYLNLSEVRELTPVEEKTDLQRIAEGFADSLKDIGNGIKESVIWFVIHIPYMVIWAAVIAILALILRKSVKKRREKKAALRVQKAKREASGQQDGQETPGTEEAGK